jgi:hypothetical protein
MPTGTQYLYVRLEGVVDLAGCEFLLLWSPAGEQFSGCYEMIAGQHPSGPPTSCTWLMRGSQVEGMNESSSNSWKVAFASDEPNDDCEDGNVARALFDFSLCGGSTPGWFSLAYVKVSDSDAEVDSVAISDTVMVGSAPSFSNRQRRLARLASGATRSGATILEGVGVELPPHLQRITPVLLTTGEEASSFSLAGFNLSQVENVIVRSNSSFSEHVAYIDAISDREISCSFWPKWDLTGLCDVEVSSSDGQSSDLRSKFTLVARSGSENLCGIRITPELADTLEQISSSEMIPAYVIMADQANPGYLHSIVKGLGREERRRLVTQELKDFSRSRQSPYISVLEELRESGHVERFSASWIVNSLSFNGDVDALREIASMGGIAYMDLFQTFKNDEGRPQESPNEGTAESPGVLKPLPVSQEPDTAWQLKHLRVPEVWAMGYKGDGVLVGVYDTGVDEEVEDLIGQMWHNEGEQCIEYPPNFWCDWDTNGFIQDCHGIDIHKCGSTFPPEEPGECRIEPGGHGAWGDDFEEGPCGHGTGAAAFVAGDGTMGWRTGIAPHAKVMSLKANVIDTEFADYAVRYGEMYGVDVYTSGWGLHWSSDFGMRTIMQNLLANGRIFCQPMKEPDITNDPTKYTPLQELYEPGDCPSPWIHPENPPAPGFEEFRTAAIAVGGTGRNIPGEEVDPWSEKYMIFKTTDGSILRSGFGPSEWDGICYQGFCYDDYPFDESGPNEGVIKPDLLAPGAGVLKTGTTACDSDYFGSNGTSNAAPQVAGVIALMISKNNEIVPEDIDRILQTTAVNADLPDNLPGKDIRYGSGRVDALAAVMETSFFNNFDKSGLACWFPDESNGTWATEEDPILDGVCYSGAADSAESESLFWESRDGTFQTDFDFVIKEDFESAVQIVGFYLRWIAPDEYLALWIYRSGVYWMIELVEREGAQFRVPLFAGIGFDLATDTRYHLEFVDEATDVPTDRRLSLAISSASDEALIWNKQEYSTSVDLGGQKGLLLWGPDAHVHFDNVYCGVIRPERVVLVSVGKENRDQSNCYLLPSFPNPFNPTTSIAYELSSTSQVFMEIFDVEGRLVQRLVNGDIQYPGRHTVVWDGRTRSGSRAASGVYFLSLRVGEERDSIKLVMIK